MLRTAERRKSGDEVGDDNKAGRGKNKIDDVEVDGGEVEVNEVEKKVQKTSKSKNLFKSQKTVGSDILTSRAKQAFNELRQAFLKAPILHHFDPDCHIQIETDVSGYAIGGALSQLTLDDSGQWHLVAFFSRKMIPAETRYAMHDGELLAIVETFKTWRHYLEGFQHEVFVLTDYNNLRQFMNTKSLSSKQVCWAQELFCYHSESNIVSIRLMELPIPCLNTLSKVLRRKTPSERRTPIFCTVCSLCWLKSLAFQ